MKVIFSSKCLEYRQTGHPESPERVKNAYEFLKSKGHEFIEAKPCSEKDLLLVHSAKHIESVRKGSAFDLDTPSLPHIYDYARIAAGGAIQAAELACKGETSFSLMRPPGHHALSNLVGGFCYFNNIAIAVSKTFKENKAKRVAILDIDAHHGNGTQDIFLGNRQVLYVSLHQSPLYPSTGLGSKLNCINYPLKPYTNDSEYLGKLSEALMHIKKFKPDILGVSAGFDTYKEETLANLKLEVGSYRKIGKEVKSLNLPIFAVLEGGYTYRLGECIHEFLKGIKD